MAYCMYLNKTKRQVVQMAAIGVQARGSLETENKKSLNQFMTNKTIFPDCMSI